MQIKIYSISIHDEGTQTEELNTFLRTHTIIDFDKVLVSSIQSPVWTFCIRYKENSQKSYTKGKSRIDYREVLDEATFKIFSILRTYRKQLAEERGVPLFAVFTNEELAHIAKLNEINVKNLLQISGIGQKRMEKYGKAIVDMYIKEKG